MKKASKPGSAQSWRRNGRHPNHCSEAQSNDQIIAEAKTEGSPRPSRTTADRRATGACGRTSRTGGRTADQRHDRRPGGAGT